MPSQKIRCSAALLVLCMVLGLYPGRLIASTWNPTLLVNTESFETIDSGDKSTNIEFRFGDNADKRISWNIVGAGSGAFKFTKAAYIQGNLTATGSLSVKKTISGATLRVDGNGDIWGSFAATGSIKTKSGAIINADNDTNDALLVFGNSTANQTLKFVHASQRFQFTTNVSVLGNLSGATINVNNLRSCDTIDTDTAGRFTCGTDTGGSGLSVSDGDARYLLKQGNTKWSAISGALLIYKGATSPTVPPLADTGVVLEVIGTVSGSVIHAQNRLESSGSLLVTGNGKFDGGTLWIDSTANRVGVNNLAPESTLEVSGNMSGRLIHAQNRIESSGSLVIRSNQTQPVLASSGSKVGIGKSVPNSALDVAGTISGSALTVSSLKACSILQTNTGGVVSCGGMVVKRKPTTQTVNNTVVPVHDASQSFKLAANDTWVFRFSNLVRAATASQTMRWHVAGPPGSTCIYGAVDIDTGITGTGATVCNYAVVTTAAAKANNISTVEVYGTIFNGATAGSGYIRWGQHIAAATNTQVLSGSTVIAFKPVGSDIAEVYRTRVPNLIPGSVVSVDPKLPSGVIRSTRAYDEKMLGVISTKPGMLIGGDDLLDGKGGLPVFLALAGRVPVMVTDENGPIAPGDYLTSSSKPGLAMRATRAGPVIGKALTGFSGPGDGVVTVFVQNSLLPDSLSDTPVRDLAGDLALGTIPDYVLPVGSLTRGRTARITARGTYSTGSVPGTLSLQIFLGSIPLCDTRENAYVPNVRDRSWTLDCTFTVRRNGILGEIDAQGLAILSTTRTEAQTIGLENLQTIRVNTAKANSLRFRSNASPPQNVHLRQMVVQFLN